MASLLSSCSLAVTISFSTMRSLPNKLHAKSVDFAGGLRAHRRIELRGVVTKRSPLPSECLKKTISCSIAAEPETLKTVQSTIAKQLSIEESTVTPHTKFVNLGADSLDIVEIMMALEEQCGVSMGEGGAENIATVQDAADLIEKVKAEAAV